MPEDTPIAFRADGSPLFDNATSVVVVAVHNSDGNILVVKRAKGLGTGQWAFPGGYQMNGQTWQEAAVAEVMEETAVHIDPKDVKLSNLITSYLGMNLIFTYSVVAGIQTTAETDGEVIEHKFINPKELADLDWAFDAHRDYAKSFY